IRDKLVTGVQTCALPIYRVLGVWEVHPGVQVAEQAAGEHHDVEKPLVRLGDEEVKRTLAVRSAARELAALRSFDQCVGYRLAGEIGRASCRERVDSVAGE